jgi:hypothetical protein
VPSVVRVPIAGKYLWPILLVALIAGPWLLPGYFFGTDWPGPRHFTVPTDFSSSTVLDAVLVVISAVVSAEVTSKLVITLALLAAAVGAFRAVPGGGFVPRALASGLYVLNPFVYGRIHYGQLALIAGYSLLPWIAARLLGLMRQPRWPHALILAAELTLLGILDLHLLVPGGLVVTVAAVAFGISRRGDRCYLTALAKDFALASGATLIASSYWLIALVAGTTSEGRAIGSVGQADLVTYSALADAHLGLIPNLLGLYGFWAEDTRRFTSMKAFAPFWPVILLLLLALLALGATAVLKRAPTLPSPRGGGRFLLEFEGGRPWVLALLGAGAIALVLEMGVANPVTEPLVRFLDTVFPPYRGMRDTGKWAALLALVYAQLIPLGAIVVLDWVRDHSPHPNPPPQGEGIRTALATGLLLALPLYYGNGLLFGSHGEIQPSRYPAGWYQADKLLVADPHPGRTLFLPWHLYMGLDFVRNTNNVVASPAPSFFSVPVVASQDPEVPNIAPPSNPDQRAIDRLVADGSVGDWAGKLARRNIKYVILAREVDWRLYNSLASQADIVMVADYGSLILYRNLRWRE